MGNTLASRKKKPNRKTLKQKGGFYPSVYGGVTGASMLAPLIARQSLRMYNSSFKRRAHKRTLKKKNKRRNTRSIA
jgi:hypothetical protein